MFPLEVVKQFVRDRHALGVFRCVCRDLSTMVVEALWRVTVKVEYIKAFPAGDCYRKSVYNGTTPYAASPLWCPFSAERYRVSVCAGGCAAAFDATSDNPGWEPFARHLAAEFRLIGEDPLIPYITIDGYIIRSLVEYVEIDPYEQHYVVVLEPPIWRDEDIREHGDKFILYNDEPDANTVTVTLLARASIICGFCFLCCSCICAATLQM